MRVRGFTTGCITVNHAGRRSRFCTGFDKETSGILVFGKNTARQQIAERTIHATAGSQKISPAHRPCRAGKRIHREDRARPCRREITQSRPGGEMAETKFTPIQDSKFGNGKLKMVFRRAAHRTHAPDPRSRRRRRLSHSRRHPLWRHGFIAGFSARRRNRVHTS